MQARLQHKASELQGLSGREEELKERLNDLNAFVEVRAQEAALLCKLTVRLAVSWYAVHYSNQMAGSMAGRTVALLASCGGWLGQHSTEQVDIGPHTLSS